MLESRKREWIEKPSSIAPPPNLAKMIFNRWVQQFREDHLEFDEFLSELGQLLKKEENADFYNIIRFINGDSETNWISTRMSLFDILIKLFNLCLSPSQALEYIKRCHEVYIKMANCNYSIARNGFSVGKEKIVLDMIPDEDVFDFYTNQFWFNVCIYPQRELDEYNDILLWNDTKIKFRSARDIQDDALMLFVYYQNKDFLKNIVNKAIELLLDYKVLKIVKITKKRQLYKIEPAGSYDLSKLKGI